MKGKLARLECEVERRARARVRYRMPRPMGDEPRLGGPRAKSPEDLPGERIALSSDDCAVNNGAEWDISECIAEGSVAQNVLEPNNSPCTVDRNVPNMLDAQPNIEAKTTPVTTTLRVAMETCVGPVRHHGSSKRTSFRTRNTLDGIHSLE